MHYRVQTSADLAEELERRHPADERERFIRSGDWRGPTIFWNMQEGFNSHDRIVEIYTEYKAVPEAWPAGMNVDTEYWEIVPADHPEGEPSHTPREHVGSWCNETETKKQLVRLRQAQHRARHILLMKEMQALGRPLAAENMRNRIFAYPDHIFDPNWSIHPDDTWAR